MDASYHSISPLVSFSLCNCDNSYLQYQRRRSLASRDRSGRQVSADDLWLDDADASGRDRDCQINLDLHRGIVLVLSVDGRTSDNVTQSTRSNPVTSYLSPFSESGDGWSPGLRPRPIAASWLDPPASLSKMNSSPLRLLGYGCTGVSWWRNIRRTFRISTRFPYHYL